MAMLPQVARRDGRSAGKPGASTRMGPCNIDRQGYVPSRPPKGIRSLSRPLEYESDEDYSEAFGEIEQAPDRIAAIVAAAVVEQSLRWALNSFFFLQITEHEERELFENDGMLSSFHAKIFMGFALGLFGEEARNDFTKIKNIRNAFAHAPRSLSFETPEIAGECEKLRYIDATAQNPKRTILPWKPLVGKSPRESFIATVKALILDLHVAGSKGDERYIELREQLGGMP
jgi:hypothetical protein